MADTSDGHAISSQSQNADICGSNSVTDSNYGIQSVSCGYIPNGGLAEELCNGYSPQNGVFVNLFTSCEQNVSSLSFVDNELDNTLHAPCSQSSQLSVDNTVILQQSDIQRLDSELSNSPRDLYIQQLLQMTANNEQMIVWYRNTLSSRAKALEGCPPGNLISRKSTKRGSSAEKLARDCFILNNFIHGSKAGIDEVYDKSKPASVTPKVTTVDLKVLVQSLMQRVSELEKSDKQKDSTINSLRTDIKNLKKDAESLRSEVNTLKTSCTLHSTKCETFQKLTSTQMKCLDGLDYTVHSKWKQKTDDEIQRLSKVSSNVHKQISEINTLKSYASVVSPKGPATSGIPANGSKSADQIMVNDATPDRPQAESRSSGDSINDSMVNVNTFETSRVSDGNTSLNTSTPDRNTKSKTVKSTSKRDNSSSDSSDIFVGVTYKRNARYFLTGIGRKSTKEGIQQYVERKGAKVSHLILFKPKTPRSLLTAKVNVSPFDAELLESDDFLPDGVRWRRWYSVREWDKIITERNTHQSEWEDWNEETDEE